MDHLAAIAISDAAWAAKGFPLGPITVQSESDLKPYLDAGAVPFICNGQVEFPEYALDGRPTGWLCKYWSRSQVVRDYIGSGTIKMRVRRLSDDIIMALHHYNSDGTVKVKEEITPMPNFGQPTKYSVDLSININFPALDALVSYLVGADQAKIDTITARIKADAAKVDAAVKANQP